MPPNKGRILVTGGAGYIGSHTVLALLSSGYEVVILDNLVYGHQDLVEQVLQVKLIIGDINNRSLLDQLFQQFSFIAVIHFAAYGYVGESVQHPTRYYRNNVNGSLTLLEAMIAAGVNKIVFSSTCATYGIPQTIPITEDHPQSPINPYGMSKLIVEKLLADFDQAYHLKYVCFRYFNAAGADPNGLLGEDHNPENHLIPLVLFTALGKQSAISIFGRDYPTIDGTCVRDYIHVCDLANAHRLGLDYLLTGKESQVFNLSNGSGFSVKQVIDTSQAITGNEIKINYCERRVGDPATLIGSSQKVTQILGWQPHYSELEVIIAHAWQWHKKRHQLT
ncbi:MAG: UDP-glucose 4-epimerase GalE [Snowella sp.]|nr:UDP-glucose 4-epimerase GalE [Snowella sp.]